MRTTPRARTVAPVLRLVALVGIACVLVTACTAIVDGSGARLGRAVTGTPVPAPIDFSACSTSSDSLPISDHSLKGRLQLSCGRLDVPLDYERPDGRTISLLVVRIHDVDNTTEPRRSLVVNPGGPGVSGVLAAFGLVAKLPARLYREYDLIGFDPRGVGGSAPVRCVSTATKERMLAQSPDVTTASGFAAAKRSAAAFARACTSKYPDSLRYFTTVNTARDMDQLRQAVGDDMLNYLGFSYGTELGWTYADLFADRVRAFVLDGAVDPDLADQSDVDPEQLRGFEQAFGQFAAACPRLTGCAVLTDPAATVRQVVASARRGPLPAGGGRRLTAGLALTGILGALYSRADWSKLATGLVQARSGDGSTLLGLADNYNERLPDGSYTNVVDANTTIACNDSRPGPTDTQIKAAIPRWTVQYPLFGPYWASTLFTCQEWQPHRTPVPAPSATTRSTVLVVGNRNDPATPYAGAQDLVRGLGNAELLTWIGQGHTSYLQGSRCIDGYVTSYLLTLRLPPDATTCPT